MDPSPSGSPPAEAPGSGAEAASGGTAGAHGVDYSSLFEASSDALLFFSRQGEELLDLNPRACELFGLDRGAAAGSPFSAVASALPFDRQQLLKAGARGPGHPAEVARLRGPAGDTYLEIETARVSYGGEPALLAICRDVTREKLAEQALDDTHVRLKLAQRAAQSLTWEWETASDALTYAALSEEIFGISAAKIPHTTRQFYFLVHPDDRPALVDAVRRCLKGEKTLGAEVRILSPDGKIRWLSHRGFIQRDTKGWAVRVVGVSTDVTDRRLAAEALEREREQERAILAAVGEGVIRISSNGRIESLNPAAEAMTGWTTADAHGRPLAEVFRVVDESTHGPLPSAAETCLREGVAIEAAASKLLMRRDRARAVIRDSAAPLADEEGKPSGAVLVFRDVSELQTLEREMFYLSKTDVATGLFNRREFEARLERAILDARERGLQYALLYIDLDRFRLVNDSYGYGAGDLLLKQVASVVKTRLRGSDVLARLGADEFGLLLKDRSPEQARAVAEELIREISGFRFSWQNLALEVGVSIGLVPIASEGGELRRILGAGEAACAIARERGGNRVQEHRMDDRALIRRYADIEAVPRIFRAFEDKRFRLYQQAVRPLALTTSQNPMSEILIRMVDDSGQLVSPGAFIPAAERYRLMSTIDRWVVTTAFRTLKRLTASRDGHPGSYSINLSGQSLGDERFLEFLVQDLSATGLAPEMICFEVTETAAISNPQRATRFFATLKGLGCRFALDDFGSGLSSFAYLRSLPVDFLKIDGQFVKKMGRDPILRALVESINHIGHLMQMRTIAEWVEDDATLSTLRDMKVDFVQSDWLDVPEPLEDQKQEEGRGLPRPS